MLTSFSDKFLLILQATLANIRELKKGLEDIDTDKIANYTEALIEGFKTLEEYRNTESGADCNQAIMLVSDGEFIRLC